MEFCMTATRKGAEESPRGLIAGRTFLANRTLAAIYRHRGWATDAAPHLHDPDRAQRSRSAHAAAAAPARGDSGEVETLRAQYETRFGRKPSGRWGAPRLRQELGLPPARGSYRRRDLLAET